MNPTYIDPDTGEKIAFEWKTPFNHDTGKESAKGGLVCKDPTKTQQSQEKEANINTIVRNFGVTGQLPQIPLPPALDEFADTFDFQSAMNVQAAARASFMALPAEVREAFYNDPHNFVSQVDEMLGEQDPEARERNLGQLRLMGLAVDPGPTPDRTTLGDLLKAIREKSTPPEGHPAERQEPPKMG